MDAQVKALRTIAEDPKFIDRLVWAYATARLGDREAINLAAEELTVRYRVQVSIQHRNLEITLPSTRAQQPTCIVVSEECGQPASPSSVYIRRASNCMIQIFERGSDDRDMGHHSTLASSGFKTQGRLLQC